MSSSHLTYSFSCSLDFLFLFFVSKLIKATPWKNKEDHKLWAPEFAFASFGNITAITRCSVWQNMICSNLIKFKRKNLAYLSTFHIHFLSRLFQLLLLCSLQQWASLSTYHTSRNKIIYHLCFDGKLLIVFANMRDQRPDSHSLLTAIISDGMNLPQVSLQHVHHNRLINCLSMNLTDF